jgi:mannose-1-phosphate guanylyltransferase
MKAILLAGGLGTRLKPITDKIPKCMVEIKGKPMLQWWKELFDKHGIADIIINVSDKYQDGDINIPNGWGVSWEDKPMGGLGTISYLKEFWGGDEFFLVAYADVLTNCNLTKMITFHKSHEYPITMGVVNVKDRVVREKGMITDILGKIYEYEEKPIYVTSNATDAGIYIFDRSILHHLPESGRSMVELFNIYLGNMVKYEIKEYLQDIGNPQDLEKANNEFQGI